MPNKASQTLVAIWDEPPCPVLEQKRHRVWGESNNGIAGYQPEEPKNPRIFGLHVKASPTRGVIAREIGTLVPYGPGSVRYRHE